MGSDPPALRMGACCSARGTGGTPGEARTGNLDLGETESCEPEVPTKPAAIIATPPATPPAGNTESVADPSKVEDASPSKPAKTAKSAKSKEPSKFIKNQMGAAASKAKKDPAAKRKTKATPESKHANPLKNAKSPQSKEPANPPPATGSPAPRRAGSKVTAAAAVTSPSPGGGSRAGSPLSIRSASPSNASVRAAAEGTSPHQEGLDERYKKLMGSPSMSPKTPAAGSTARTQSPKQGETPEQVERRWTKEIDRQMSSPEIRSDSPARSVLDQGVDI